jgi:hypothetical protein
MAQTGGILNPVHLCWVTMACYGQFKPVRVFVFELLDNCFPHCALLRQEFSVAEDIQAMPGACQRYIRTIGGLSVVISWLCKNRTFSTPSKILLILTVPHRDFAPDSAALYQLLRL